MRTPGYLRAAVDPFPRGSPAVPALFDGMCSLAEGDNGAPPTSKARDAGLSTPLAWRQLPSQRRKVPKPRMKVIMSTRLWMLSLMLMPIATTMAQTSPSTPVQTRAGLITGTATSTPSVRAYLGVPFAAAPVGEGRWRPPRPLTAWSGLRAADHFSPSCMQPAPAAFGPW